jgi:hypothetical protein
MTGREEIAERMERYLARLDRALTGVQDQQREDIVREIRCHIVERTEGAGERAGEALDDTLWGLGAPETLARSYRSDAQLLKASRSWSPWVLVRTALRWARAGATGFGIFMTALVGYSISASLFISGVAKPLFPDYVGLWYDPPSINLGWRNPDQPPARELLGQWLPLVVFVLGLLVLMATNHVMRHLIRHLIATRRQRPAWRTA